MNESSFLDIFTNMKWKWNLYDRVHAENRTINDFIFSVTGFIDFIVEPSMAVCGDMLEVIVNALNSPSSQTGTASSQESQNGTYLNLC